jgi:hypothetical protein
VIRGGDLRNEVSTTAGQGFDLILDIHTTKLIHAQVARGYAEAGKFVVDVLGVARQAHGMFGAIKAGYTGGQLVWRYVSQTAAGRAGRTIAEWILQGAQELVVHLAN